MPLFEDQTPEVIKNRILSRMGTSLQTREGSYTNDMVAPVSYELWRMLMTLGELVSAFYVDEDSGPYLDEHAALLGLSRREGTRAQAEIQFSGRDGVLIPAGTAFFTSDGLEFDLIEDVELAAGMGPGTLRATEVGEKYNVGAGEIEQIARSISGLSQFDAGAARGGADRESDEALYARIVFRRQNPSTSGNENHYKEWALSCDGVGSARVTRLWNGPGTVRVLLAGYDRGPVDSAVVEACAAYIETQRPVGAEVTVVSATGVSIDVRARLTLDGSVSRESVKERFMDALGGYLRSIALEGLPVYIHRVAALLMSVEGLVDYEDLTVNGGTENIPLDTDSAPVVGEVTFI